MTVEQRPEQLAANALRVLVACEFSGIVRDAFIARGHKAMSCDLEPSGVQGRIIKGMCWTCWTNLGTS